MSVAVGRAGEVTRLKEDRDSNAAAVSRRGALFGIGAALAAAAAIADNGSGEARTQADQTAMPESLPPDAPPDFKVLFHASETSHWPYVVSNLRNQKQMWRRAHPRVVVGGSAVYPLQGQNALTDELTQSAAAGIELEVCPNALREHQIDPATIPSFAKTSLGGVVALVAAQRDGYVYVKP